MLIREVRGERLERKTTTKSLRDLDAGRSFEDGDLASQIGVIR